MIDPISAGLGIVGVGLQLFGGMAASEKASEMSGLNRQIAEDERSINNQKRTAMELSARRDMLQQFRNAQRLRAQATAAAVNQGASQGTGLQGGLSQVMSQNAFNVAGISQNLEIGRNIFGINDSISYKKSQISDLQGEMATDQALASLGGSLVKLGPTIGGLSQDAYAWGKRNIGFNPGGPYV